MNHLAFLSHKVGVHKSAGRKRHGRRVDASSGLFKVLVGPRPPVVDPPLIFQTSAGVGTAAVFATPDPVVPRGRIDNVLSVGGSGEKAHPTSSGKEE